MQLITKKIVSLNLVDSSYAFLSYGIDTILVIYLVNVLHLSDFEALSSLGVKSCLVYSLPIVTAFLSTHWIAKELITFIGLALMSLGLIILGGMGSAWMTMSLSFLTVGYILGRPVISIVLGRIIPPQNNAHMVRIFHAVSNIAYTLAPILFSLSLKGLQDPLFLIIGVSGLLVSFVFLKIFFDDVAVTSWLRLMGGLVIILGLVAGVSGLLVFPNYLKYLFFTALGTGLFYGWRLFQNKNSGDLSQLKQFFLLILIAGLFFICFSQQLFFMPLFIEKYVNFSIGSFKIPTPWFGIINPIIGMIVSPFIIYITKDIKEPQTIAPLVFCLTGLGFLCLFVGMIVHSLTVWMIVLTYLFLGIAELMLVPLILSFVSTWRFEKEKSILMGYLYLSMACSKILSPQIALWIPFPTHLSESVIQNPYAIPFSIIGGSLILFSIILRLILDKLYKFSALTIELNK